jgi:hypothetical protein
MGEATDAVDALFERLRPYIRILVDHGEVREIIADAIKAAEAAAYERAAQVADAERTASGGIIAAAIRRLAEPRAGR